MLFIKFTGIFLTVISSIFMGFFKSRLLAERCKKLSKIYDGANTLYSYVEEGGCELCEALKYSFLGVEFITYKNGNIVCNDACLTKEDNELIKSFFNALGSSIKKTECEKINNFKIKLNTHIKNAEANYAQKAKIYQTFGICIGLTLAVLFI